MPSNLRTTERSATIQGLYKKSAWATQLPVAPDWTVSKLSSAAPTPLMDPQGRESSDSPPKKPTRNRDMFFGHGMYKSLWPIGYAMAFFGLLPVTFGPVRISLHPLRSTLVYCLAVTAVVLWSGHAMVVDRSAILKDPHVTLQGRFNSILSITHVLGLGLLPLLWFEATNLCRNGALCAVLMETFPSVQRCPWMAALPWLTIVNGALGCPMTALLYIHVIAKEGGHDAHLLIHNHVELLVFSVGFLFATMSHCVKSYAHSLQSRVTEELARPYPCPKRLLAFRRAWLRLHDLTTDMVVMPMTAMYLLLFGLLMTTLGAYLCLVCFFEGQIVRGAFMGVLGSLFFGLLLLICDAVHRTTAAVGEKFLRPLETYCGAGIIGDAAMDEINLFRDVVASKEITVSAAGFWTINRGTMSSLAATAASYLIVLIQFRQTENSAGNASNGTLETSALFH